MMKIAEIKMDEFEVVNCRWTRKKTEKEFLSFLKKTNNQSAAIVKYFKDGCSGDEKITLYYDEEEERFFFKVGDDDSEFDMSIVVFDHRIQSSKIIFDYNKCMFVFCLFAFRKMSKDYYNLFIDKIVFHC